MKKSSLITNLDNIKELIISKNNVMLQKRIKNLHSADLSELVNLLENDENLIYLMRVLSSKIVSEVFVNLDIDKKIFLLEEFNTTELSQIINQLYADDIIELLENIPEEIMKKIINSASREKRKEINILLNYEENSAGSIMSLDYVYLLEDEKVTDALQKVKNLGERAENIDNYYVTNEKMQLLGVINLRSLVFSNNNSLIKEVMLENVVSVNAGDDQEEVANVFRKYDLNEVPVVNKENNLLGIITVDDILDVIQEEATEDIEKMAAINPTDMLYLKTPIWKIVRSRIFWLLFLLVSATFSELVIDAFLPLFGVDKDGQETSSKILNLLVPLLPVIADTGGNSGSQSSTTIVRSLSLGDVKIQDYRKVLFKELQVSFFVGIILIFFNFLRMIIINLIKYNGTLEWEHWAAMISLSISLWVVIIISKVAGGLLPILAKLVKLDPAVMAAPLVTTIIDCLSTTIFFSTALLIFPYS